MYKPAINKVIENCVSLRGFFAFNDFELALNEKKYSKNLVPKASKYDVGMSFFRKNKVTKMFKIKNFKSFRAAFDTEAKCNEYLCNLKWEKYM